MGSGNDIRAFRERVFADLGLYQEVSGLFDGGWGAGAQGRRLAVHSPIDGAQLADVAVASEEDFGRLIENAWASFREWSRIPAPKRGEVVRAIGERLRRHMDSLGLLIALEVGKTPIEGRGEVQEMIDICDFAVGLSRQLYGKTMASERLNHRLYEHWHPHGVVGVITAFNFPCAVWSWNAFIAAVIGNVVVWKPSPEAALTAIAVTNIMNEVLDDHGLPPIFFLAVDESGEIGKCMSRELRLPLISFTGSVSTGKEVAAAVNARASVARFWSWAATTRPLSPRTRTRKSHCAASPSARWPRPDSGVQRRDGSFCTRASVTASFLVSSAHLAR